MDQLATALGLTVKLQHDPDWLLPSLPWTGASHGPGAFQGHGCGPDQLSAATIAVMESAERRAQFGDMHTAVVTIDSAAALGDRAMHVPDLGLYSEQQYRHWGRKLSRYSPTTPVAWVAGTRVRDSREVLVPLEAIHPRASTPAAPLVFETSSGTAAGFTRDAALGSALCEAVERDAALLWWYTRTPTARLDVSASAGVADDLERLAGSGFVVVSRLLASVTTLAVVMVTALRGHQVAVGLGCAPDPADAASHALRELSPRLRWILDHPDRRVLHLPIPAVRTAADHVGLYDRGPLHSQLRQALEETTTERVVSVGSQGSGSTQPPPADTISAVLAARLDPIAVELPVRPASSGIRVVRVLVPGLVPFWVGSGHERLWSAPPGPTPGTRRLKTLLPHPFG